LSWNAKKGRRGKGKQHDKELWPASNITKSSPSMTLLWRHHKGAQTMKKKKKKNGKGKKEKRSKVRGKHGKKESGLLRK